jgi:spermidine synthase
LPWGFTLASKKNDPRKFSPQQVDDMIAKRIKGENRYYDGITNQGMYMLPKHIRKALAEETKIIEDNAPLFTYH